METLYSAPVMIRAKSPEWSITPAKVEAAIRRIVEVSRAKKLILFGSYIRGVTGPNSDLDILVVTSKGACNPRQESVRIRRALTDILMAMDILVVPEHRFEKLRDTPGLVYREALKTGRVVYES